MNHSNENKHMINFYDIISSFQIIKKRAFNKYLTELWKDLSLQSPDILKGLSREVFYSYFNYPEVINKHLFTIFTKKGHYVNLEQFISGMNNLYSHNFDILVNLVFDLYDYDRDNVISKEDILLILSYIQTEPLIKNEINEEISFGNLTYAKKVEHQEEIYQILNAIAKGNFELTREKFISVIVDTCSDILLIPLFYLYQKRPFTMGIINSYDEEEKNENNENYYGNIISEPRSKEIIEPLQRYKYAVPFLHEGKRQIIRNKVFFNCQSLNNAQIKALTTDKVKSEEQKEEVEKAPLFYMRRNYNRKDTVSKEKKKSQRRSTYIDLINMFQKEQTDYAGFMFKITKQNNMKIYWFKLILNDLFYYKNRTDQFHLGMHHLSGLFLEKNGIITFKGVELYSFSLIYPKKVRKFYLDKKENYDYWTAHIGKNIKCFKINNFYEIGEVISQTKFCTTYKGVQTSTNLVVTIKKIDKLKTSKTDLKLIKNNLNILKFTQHPNIIKLFDVYEEEKFFYYVLEYYEEVDLFTYIEKRNYKSGEEKTCEIIHQLLTAVYYLHYHGIIHRDLKPENIIMTEQDGKMQVKLVNFELSKLISGGETANEPYGTLSYVAPEILLEKPYGREVDLWSIGIITFLLLCGSLPFDDEHSEREIARQTIHDKVPFRDSIWKNLSPEAKDFVGDLLVKNPIHRLTITEALMHDWIKLYFKDDVEKRVKCQNENGFEFFNFTHFGDL